jgi:hypothetical protein
MKREFAIAATDTRLVWLLPGVSAVAAMLAIAYAAATQRQPMLWLVLPVLLGSFALLAFMLRRTRVTLDAGTLTIAAGLLTRRVAVANLALDAARIVDLREHGELRPLIKVFGTRLPGHSSGHFRLRDRRAAFVLVTDRSRVLVLPETSGKTLLLSLQQPQALLDALQQVRT